jgi:hypothetical protein
MLKTLVLVLLAIFLIGGIILFYLHFRSTHDARQLKFKAGKVPSPLPDGLYKGMVSGRPHPSWQGKKFSSADNSGINIFKVGSSNQEKFPFKTSVGPGIVDKDISVLKIDYNISQNPVWLRFILDEVVEVSPNHYLGKLQFRALPFMTFTLGYFDLEKNVSN